jgi:hypothetical protein
MGVISCGTTMIDNGAFQGLAVLSWDTTAKTASFTAVAGNGYFVNTTSGSITVTLPSSPSAGDQVAIKDYAATAGTNKIVLARNGSNINGAAADADIVTNGESATLLYVDGTQGWSVILDGNKDAAQDQKFVTATGGTITTDGDFKIHTFTGPGTFCVSCAGSSTGSTDIDYLIVAGGGGGGGGSVNVNRGAGGGGAGGFRETPGNTTEYIASNFNKSLSTLTVAATGYPVTVGAGGTGGTQPNPGRPGAPGSNSVFNSNTAAGGGGVYMPCVAPNNLPNGRDGGSGGGGPSQPNPGPKKTGGQGNVPAVFGVQGFPGADGYSDPATPGLNGEYGGGGGGASQKGLQTNSAGGSGGGDGSTTGIKGTASGDAFAGGGGGFGGNANTTGGVGGGGDGARNANNPANISGTANTGGGGGGGYQNGGSGGSGVVVIRYKFQ